MAGSEANTGAMSAVAGSHEKVRLQCDLYGPRRADGDGSRYDARVRDLRPKSITRICRRASIKTELFRLEDHLLYIPRQDVSGDVPMRLDVSAVGPTNRVGHRVCDKLPQRPQS